MNESHRSRVGDVKRSNLALREMIGLDRQAESA